VIGTTPEERNILGEIEQIDDKVQRLKNRLRAGELITEI